MKLRRYFDLFIALDRWAKNRERLDNAASGWYYIGIAFAIGHMPVQGFSL